MYVNTNFKNTKRIFPMQGRGKFKRFDMNENPSGLPSDFIDKVLENITPDFLSTYPETKAFIKKYSSYIGVTEDNIAVTNGTDMAIRYLFESFAEPGKKVVTVSPSFEMYRINCSLLGLIHCPVEYNDDLSVDIDRLVEAIDIDTSIVVLLNPNNPVGDAYTGEEFERILKKTKETDSLLIVDEAYHYFYPETFLSYVESEKNLVILRTFSKLFSIASCRLGVIIGAPELIKVVKNGQLSFDVNSFALLFGEKLLENPSLIEKLIADERAGREYLENKLRDNNYSFIPCKGNYILIKTKNEPKEVEKRLYEKKILIHSYTNKLLKDYIRVSTGNRESMEEFFSYFIDSDTFPTF